MAFRITEDDRRYYEEQKKLIKHHEKALEQKIDVLMQQQQEKVDVLAQMLKDNQDLSKNFEKIDQHDMSSGTPVQLPETKPYKLNSKEPLHCKGGGQWAPQTWIDNYDNIVAHCNECNTMQTVYVDGTKTYFNDHMSAPLGHKCSECNGSIWVEDNYMCAPCIEAMT